MPTIPNTSDTQPKMIRKIRTILMSNEFREFNEFRELNESRNMVLPSSLISLNSLNSLNSNQRPIRRLGNYQITTRSSTGINIASFSVIPKAS